MLFHPLNRDDEEVEIKRDFSPEIDLLHHRLRHSATSSYNPFRFAALKMSSSSSQPFLRPDSLARRCKDCYAVLEGDQTQDDWITNHLLYRKGSCLETFNRVIARYNADLPESFER